jgi:hypothetical protein
MSDHCLEIQVEQARVVDLRNVERDSLLIACLDPLIAKCRGELGKNIDISTHKINTQLDKRSL